MIRGGRLRGVREHRVAQGERSNIMILVPPTPAVSINNVLFFFNSFESYHYSKIPPGKSLTSLPLIPYLLVEQRSSRMDFGLRVWIRQSDYRFTPAPVSPGVVQLQGSTCDIPGTTPSTSSFLSSLSLHNLFFFFFQNTDSFIAVMSDSCDTHTPIWMVNERKLKRRTKKIWKWTVAW